LRFSLYILKFLCDNVDINLKPEEIDTDVQKTIEKLTDIVTEKYLAKEQEVGEEQLREVERVVMLKVVDQKWMDHIDAMDELKDGIGLRAYGQKDPVALYRIEGFEMFDQMVNDIKADVVKILLHLEKVERVERVQTVKITGEGLKEEGEKPNKTEPEAKIPVRNTEEQVGRNDPCPCGSGKKYKNCCGRNQ